MILAFWQKVDIRTIFGMKKVITLLLGVFGLCYFTACQQKMICPAFHSSFILDTDETRNKFSLFGVDSLPKKRWEVDKEKYGIATDIPDERKMREMRIISMESIYKKIEDPFDEFRRMYAEADPTIMIDSAAIMADIRGANDFTNIDQMIYLYHFGKYLPAKNTAAGLRKPDNFKEDMIVEESPIISDDDQTDQPRKKRGLFKRKDKPEPEEVSDVEEEDYY